MEENGKQEEIMNETDLAKPRDHHDSSSTSSSSDSDGESSKTRANDDYVKSTIEIENLVNEKEEFFQVEVEPLIENTINETETLLEDGTTNVAVSSSDVNEMESVKDLSSSVKQYVLEANEMKEQNILLSLEEKNGFSPNVIENGLGVPDDPVTEETQVVRSYGVAELKPREENVADDFNARENVDPALEQLVYLPTAVADKSAERDVEVETPENMTNQPMISLAPRARCLTSWTSCCGLFEVLRSPDR